MIQYVGWLMLFVSWLTYVVWVQLWKILRGRQLYRESKYYLRLQAYDPFSDDAVPGGQILQLVCADLSWKAPSAHGSQAPLL